MAKFQVRSIEPRPDKKLACDTWVLIEVEGEDDEGNPVIVDKAVGHFSVILDAVTVNKIKGTKAQRTAQYLKMFSADPRIAGIVDAEAAAAKIGADVTFPVEVTL